MLIPRYIKPPSPSSSLGVTGVKRSFRDEGNKDGNRKLNLILKLLSLFIVILVVVIIEGKENL